MKKIILLAALALSMVGCFSLKETARVTIPLVYDFTEYSRSGFFITPYEYSGNDYEPVGIVNIRIYPAVIYGSPKLTGKEFANEKEEKEYIRKNMIYYEYMQETISSKELLDIVVEHAKKMGANGLASLKITIENKTTYERKYMGEYLSHYEVSGFAIKRK